MADLPITRFIDMNISTTAGAVSSTTFGTPLVLTDEGVYDDGAKYREYASLAEVAVDWATSTTAYKKANFLFTQDLTVDLVKIATCESYVAQVQTIVFSADIVIGNIVLITVDGEVITQGFTTDHLTTITALAAQIAALDGVSTAVVGGTGNRTITVTAQTAGASVDIEDEIVTDGASQATIVVSVTTANQGPVEDLTTLITDYTDSFYLAMYTNDTLALVKKIATYIETLDKQFWTYTNDSTAINSVSTADLRSWLSARSYRRTFAIYSDDSDSQADAAISGLFLPQDVGDYAIHGKTPIGLASDDLTTTQYGTLNTKGYIHVGTIGGLTKIVEPSRTDGVYADGIRSDDAFKAFMQEGVLNFIFAQNYLPYNDPGISAFLSEVQRLLSLAVQQNYIDSYTNPTAPALADISASDIAARHLPDVEFSARKKNAIYRITVNGTLTQQ